MTTRDGIDAAALAIADRHGCHTIILYGSRARGDADAGSDVDLLCIRDDGPAVRDSRVIDGIYFDAFVSPRDAVATPDVALLRILGGQVMRERDGAGTALLDRVRALFDKGPDPLPADEQTARIVWAHKMLDRIRANDGSEGHYRRMSLAVQALEDYFALRALWFRGPKVAFPWLLTHDDVTHQAFDATMQPTADHDALVALVDVVYGPLPATDPGERP
jgi:predicted nucleotidyltransferase